MALPSSDLAPAGSGSGSGSGASPRRRLRILTSTQFLDPVGGIELCLDEDVRSLVARGHSVEILYAEEGSMRAGFEALGVTLTGAFSFVFRPAHALSDLARFVASARRARRSRADVLWLNRPEYLVWAQFVARAARLPLVVHLHHAPNYDRLRTLSRGVERFIAVSDYMKQQWVARGVPVERITVVPNAVPLENYPEGGRAEQTVAQAALGIAPGTRVALYLGRMVESKGVSTLLEAWRILALPAGTAILVLAGSEIDPAIAELVDALPEGTVRVLPIQDDVVPLLHAADLVVAPSWEPESFGRVLVEALSSGRPAIGTRQGGMREILTGEMERFLIEPQDAAGLVRAMSELLPWRDTEPRLGERCRAFAEDHFSRERHVDDLEALLAAAVGAHRR